MVPNVTETLIVVALSFSRQDHVDFGFVSILQKPVRGCEFKSLSG